MISRHCPNIAWPETDGWAGSNLTQRWENNTIYYTGATPVVMRLFGNQGSSGRTSRETFRRLKGVGIRQVMCILFHPYGGELPAPEALPGIYQNDIDNMKAEGLYPIIVPRGEEIEHLMYTPAQLAAWDRAAMAACSQAWGLYCIPGPLTQDKGRAPGYIAAFDGLWRECGACTFNFYAVTRADLDPGQLYTPEWYAAHYPECQLFNIEWGMLRDPTNAGSPVWTDAERESWILSYGPRAINCPGLAFAGYFIEDGTPDWRAQFLNTDGKLNAMRIICDKSRAARIWPRGAAPVAPPAEPADYDPAHLRVSRALLERIRQRMEGLSAAAGGIDSDAQEAIDRLVMAGLK